MFKDSNVWLQITVGNQMLGEFGFPLNPTFVRMWIPFKTGEHLKRNYIFYIIFYSLKQFDTRNITP